MSQDEIKDRWRDIQRTLKKCGDHGADRDKDRVHHLMAIGGSRKLRTVRNALEGKSDVHALLRSVADLKDHLKKYLDRNGSSGRDVESLINGNRDLQVCIDLSNRIKHGPPDRPTRTGDEITLGAPTIEFDLAKGGPIMIVQKGSGAKTVRDPRDVRIDMPNREYFSADFHAVRLDVPVLDSALSNIGEACEVAVRAADAWRAFMIKHRIPYK